MIYCRPFTILSIVLLSLPLPGWCDDLLEFNAVVESLPAADTLIVKTENTLAEIRVRGIDAPNRIQPQGGPALKAALKFVDGHPVKLICSASKKGECDVLNSDGASLAEILLSSGLAWFDYRNSDDKKLLALQEDAQATFVGIWNNRGKKNPPWVEDELAMRNKKFVNATRHK